MPAPIPTPAVVVTKFVIDLTGENVTQNLTWGPGHDVSHWIEDPAALISSKQADADPEDPLSAPWIPIREDIARLICRGTARISFLARTAGSEQFAASYVVEKGENSGWTVFNNIDSEYREYILQLELPVGAGAAHRICLWGDPTGSNLAVLIKRIEIVVERPLDRDERGDNSVDGVVNELRQWSYDRLYKDGDVDTALTGLRWVSRLRATRPSRDNWLGREDDYVVRLLDHVMDWRRQPPPGADDIAESASRVIISIPVWGSSFVTCLTDILLPSLLAEGNIPALSQRAEVLLYILAPAADAALIQGHPICDRLHQFARVEFIIVDNVLSELITNDPEDGRRYWLYGALHQLTLHYAKVLDADIFLLNPDTIYSQNSLGGLYDLGQKGTDAVIFTSLRLNRSAAIRQFREYVDFDGTLSLPALDLANIAVEFIHPVHRRCFMFPENHDFLSRMVNLYWEVPGAIVMHAAHLQPHFISRRALGRLSGLDYNTVDTRLISRMFVTPDDLKKLLVLSKTDEICYFELTPEERQWQPSREGFPMHRFAEDWFWPSCTPLNEWMFRQKTEIPLENQPYIGLRPREAIDAESKFLISAVARARPR